MTVTLELWELFIFGGSLGGLAWFLRGWAEK